LIDLIFQVTAQYTVPFIFGLLGQLTACVVELRQIAPVFGQ
jgi:hypothetical protein